jgi:hypothetical protein
MGHECGLALTILPTMPTAPGNMAARTSARALAQSVGIVGYQKTIANIANILHGLRLGIVGIANIANIVTAGSW